MFQFQQRSRLARGRIDFREPLTDHDLNIGRISWWVALPGRIGGSFWWDFVRNYRASVADVTYTGWTNTSKGSGLAFTDYRASLSFPAPSMSFQNYTFITTLYSTGYPIFNISKAGYLNNVGIEFNLTGSATIQGDAYFATGNVVKTAKSPSALAANTFYQVVFTAQANAVALYLNGNQVAITTGTFSSMQAQNSGYNFTGPNTNQTDMNKGFIVLDSGYYNRVLSSTEIAQNFYLWQQGYPGVLRRRRSVIYSLPSSPSVSGFKPAWAYMARGTPVLGTGVF